MAKMNQAQQKKDTVTVNTLRKAYFKFQEDFAKQSEEYVKTHPKSFISLLIIESLFQQMVDPAKITTYFNGLDKELKANKHGKKIKSQLDLLNKPAAPAGVEVGSLAPDFSAPGPDGKVISLGDGGAIKLQFESPISDGDGADFAVFENSFNNTFLELAYVEVSSDGKHFVRFPSTSLSQNSVQFGNDAFMDPTQLNNLAGKYRGAYGTPFDLNDLKDSAGIDLESITHIKLIDVVGSIDQKFGSSDSHNNLINDPYPTPYPSGGFDLDAVGVIHSNVLNTSDLTVGFKVYPNPTTDLIYLQLNKSTEVSLIDITGQFIENKTIDCSGFLDLSRYPKGTYYLCMEDKRIRITRL